MPPKATRANTPEARIPPTPNRVTRARSREQSIQADPSVGDTVTSPTQPNGTAAATRSGGLQQTPSAPRGTTPEASGRQATSYGGSIDAEFAIKDPRETGPTSLNDRISAHLDASMPPNATKASTTAAPVKTTRSAKRTSISSKSPSTRQSASSSSKSTAKRRDSNLDSIEEDLEQTTATPVGNHQDAAAVEVSSGTVLGTPYPAQPNESEQISPEITYAELSSHSDLPDGSHITSLTSFFKAYYVIPLLISFAIFLFLRILPSSSAMVDGILSYASIAQNSLHSLIPKSQIDSFDSSSLWNLELRMQNLEDRVEILSVLLKSMRDDVSSIRSELPNSMVVRIQNGKPVIPEELWHALKARISNDGILDEAWEQFLRSQKFKNSEYFRGPLSGVSDKEYQRWLKNHAAITKEEVLLIMHENVKFFNEEMRRQRHSLDQKLVSMESAITKEVMAVSSNQITNGLASKPEWESVPFILRNMARNTELALQQINWFAPSIGAIVDPLRSSPTAEQKLNLRQKFFFRFIQQTWAHPHVMALEPWFEARDCWCAAQPLQETGRSQDRDGDSTDEAGVENTPKAQLAVNLPRAIYPKSITVEHVPAAGTPDWRAAPKVMELWASVANETLREWITQGTDVVYDANRDPAYHEQQIQRRRGHDLDASYVRIGMWTYDVEGPNHIQNFPLGIDVERWGAPISKVAVRALTNHGGDFTCFYRLRLHGKTVEAT